MDSPPESGVVVRPARPADIVGVRALVSPYVDRRFIVAKPPVAYYESVQEFVVAIVDERVVGCGALHVMWADLAEVRTLAVLPEYRGAGIGHLILEALLARARDLRLERVFCLTFEVGFFRCHGFGEIAGTPVTPRVYAELLRSHDDGVAEFLDLARVKPNTLGNTRMLLSLALDRSVPGAGGDEADVGATAASMSGVAGGPAPGHR
ncbi:MAG: amino-acid N-acetyltransferase [Bifidobacteriaceae bacterium]|jgi:amino-acid N-acetyltransferase|nr:amino-acid N-acetyltransferase [Bifidobacteriaceae bacterium]